MRKGLFRWWTNAFVDVGFSIWVRWRLGGRCRDAVDQTVWHLRWDSWIDATRIIPPRIQLFIGATVDIDALRTFKDDAWSLLLQLLHLQPWRRFPLPRLQLLLFMLLLNPLPFLAFLQRALYKIQLAKVFSIADIFLSDLMHQDPLSGFWSFLFFELNLIDGRNQFFFLISWQPINCLVLREVSVALELWAWRWHWIIHVFDVDGYAASWIGWRAQSGRLFQFQVFVIWNRTFLALIGWLSFNL